MKERLDKIQKEKEETRKKEKGEWKEKEISALDRFKVPESFE